MPNATSKCLSAPRHNQHNFVSLISSLFWLLQPAFDSYTSLPVPIR
jgi:hypothetical protein